MRNGENEQALGSTIDLLRMVAYCILLAHCYYYCYGLFYQAGFSHAVGDKLLLGLVRTHLFTFPLLSKGIALFVLVLVLAAQRGRPKEDLRLGSGYRYLFMGALAYFGSLLLFRVPLAPHPFAYWYLGLTWLGFGLLQAGAGVFSRYIYQKLASSPFNEENETFPQEERLLENEYSVNLPTRYRLKGRVRQGWINFINPFRSILVIGTPGAGKSFFVVRNIITQHIRKGFCMFIYDFKFDDLTKICYNTLRQNLDKYAVTPTFYVLNFDDLSRTHRCNPIRPQDMLEISDAAESARTILLGLNREWIKKGGDFWVESPINFITAIIWFLKKYQDGRYCTLPHVIELSQVDYAQLFPLLQTEPQIETYINAFSSAYYHGAAEQLEGQIASARIGMARLSSPALYYVLSGDDMSLDINNPQDPKIICMGNNPAKRMVYGAVLSLYVTRMIAIVNRKNCLKSSLIFDEFPTIFFNDIDLLMATARANKVSTTLAVQDASQLKKDYGRDQADVIMNVCGNVVSGQVAGETAKSLSERFGKIVQQRTSLSINSQDTSISHSTQLDYAIPASKIAALSSGEFVGSVADNPDQKIALKTFKGEIINDLQAIKEEEAAYVELPQIRQVTPEQVEDNFRQIKRDVQQLVAEIIANLPATASPNPTTS